MSPKLIQLARAGRAREQRERWDFEFPMHLLRVLPSNEVRDTELKSRTPDTLLDPPSLDLKNIVMSLINLVAVWRRKLT